MGKSEPSLALLPASIDLYLQLLDALAAAVTSVAAPPDSALANKCETVAALETLLADPAVALSTLSLQAFSWQRIHEL